MQIVITRKARDNINQIAEYIAKDSLYYAKKTVNEIYNRIFALDKNSGRKVIILNRDNVREIIYKNNYRIIFEVTEDIIYVKLVWHSARNPKKLIVEYNESK